MAALCLFGTLYDVWFIMTEPGEEDDEKESDSSSQTRADDDVEILIPPTPAAEKRQPGMFRCNYTAVTRCYTSYYCIIL